MGSERPPDFPEGVGDVWQVEGRSVRHIPGDILKVGDGRARALWGAGVRQLSMPDGKGRQGFKQSFCPWQPIRGGV